MFQKIKQKRIIITLFIVIIFALAITIRILYVQIFSYNNLNKLANNLWQRNLPITADRGRILDRNGKVLATNITTTTIYVVPNQIQDKEKVAKYETDKDGNKVLRYSSPFEEANVADDVKCYLAHKPRHSGEFVPAIKEKRKYINLITMKDNKEYDGVDSISFTAIAMFNL